MGKKPIDVIGLRGCQACHDWLDRRAQVGLHDQERDTYILEGLLRTLRALHAEGLI